jgi:hypothetical protein
MQSIKFLLHKLSLTQFLAHEYHIQKLKIIPNITTITQFMDLCDGNLHNSPQEWIITWIKILYGLFINILENVVIIPVTLLVVVVVVVTNNSVIWVSLSCSF